MGPQVHVRSRIHRRVRHPGMGAAVNDPQSKVERVKHGARETTTHLVTVDDLIVYRTKEGGLCVEFVRCDAKGKPAEGYRVTVCPEDAERIRKA